MRKAKINFSFIVIVVVAVALLSIILVVRVFNNRIKSIENKTETSDETHP